MPWQACRGGCLCAQDKHERRPEKRVRQYPWDRLAQRGRLERSATAGFLAAPHSCVGEQRFDGQSPTSARSPALSGHVETSIPQIPTDPRAVSLLSVSRPEAKVQRRDLAVCLQPQPDDVLAQFQSQRH